MCCCVVNRVCAVSKVGIGPGSVCTTRKKTGVGYPQLSAVMECADAAHGLGGRIVSDGGCAVPGDLAKAFGAGADFVMLGGMLAGHDESGGKVIEGHDGKKSVEFYVRQRAHKLHAKRSCRLFCLPSSVVLFTSSHLPALSVCVLFRV